MLIQSHLRAKPILWGVKIFIEDLNLCNFSPGALGFDLWEGKIMAKFPWVRRFPLDSIEKFLQSPTIVEHLERFRQEILWIPVLLASRKEIVRYLDAFFKDLANHHSETKHITIHYPGDPKRLSYLKNNSCFAETESESSNWSSKNANDKTTWKTHYWIMPIEVDPETSRLIRAATEPLEKMIRSHEETQPC